MCASEYVHYCFLHESDETFRFSSTLIFLTIPENPSNKLIVDMDIKVRIVCKTKELRFSTIYMYSAMCINTLVTVKSKFSL